MGGKLIFVLPFISGVAKGIKALVIKDFYFVS